MTIPASMRPPQPPACPLSGGARGCPQHRPDWADQKPKDACHLHGSEDVWPRTVGQQVLRFSSLYTHTFNTASGVARWRIGSSRAARSAIFPAPPPFMSRAEIATGTPSASVRRLSHRTYPSSLLPSHATNTGRLIRQYVRLRNLRDPAERAGQIVRVDVALPPDPPDFLQAVD